MGLPVQRNFGAAELSKFPIECWTSSTERGCGRGASAETPPLSAANAPFSALKAFVAGANLESGACTDSCSLEDDKNPGPSVELVDVGIRRAYCGWYIPNKMPDWICGLRLRFLCSARRRPRGEA